MIWDKIKWDESCTAWAKLWTNWTKYKYQTSYSSITLQSSRPIAAEHTAEHTVQHTRSKNKWKREMKKKEKKKKKKYSIETKIKSPITEHNSEMMHQIGPSGLPWSVSV